MKRMFKSIYNVPFFLLIAGFIFTGCCYPVSKKVPSPFINGELNPSGVHKVVTYRVVGRGIEPENSKTKAEAILMAERAAVADGHRQLVEKLHGVYLDTQTLINNGSVNYTLLYEDAQAWIRGVEVIEITRLSNGITEAEMIVKLNFVKQKGFWCPRGLATEPAYSSPSNSPLINPAPPTIGQGGPIK